MSRWKDKNEERKNMTMLMLTENKKLTQKK